LGNDNVSDQCLFIGFVKGKIILNVFNNLWIANFLFRCVGRQNLSSNCNKVDTSCGIVESYRFINHLSFVYSSTFLDLLLNLWESMEIFMSFRFPSVFSDRLNLFQRHWHYNTKKTLHQFITLAILIYYRNRYVSFLQTDSVAYNLIPIKSFVEWRIVNLFNNLWLFHLVACNLSHWPHLIILILIKYWRLDQILNTTVLTKQWRTVYILQFYTYGPCTDTKTFGILYVIYLF